MFPKSMSIAEFDPEIKAAIEAEEVRQEEHIELIASENYASPRVMEAQGSVLTNKYAEGYPGKRYYGGCENVDVVEQLAIDRACELFGADWANVQPHSGSQANGAVYMAMLKAGDTVLGMSLDAGGHLTHGAKPNFSGKTYNAIQYGLDNETGLIDYEQVASLAREHKPKMIVAGFSAYSQVVDWQRFRDIADEVGAILLVDMARGRSGCGGCVPQPGGHRRHHYHYDPQDSGWSPWRPDHGQGQRRHSEEDQLCRVPRWPGWPAGARDCRQGNLLQGSHAG